MTGRPGRLSRAVVLALVGGLLTGTWLLIITVIVLKSIGRHTE